MKKKIMVISESRAENLEMKILLSSEGYDVQSANEYDYKHLFKTFKPDLILVNQRLLHSHGELIALELKGKNEKVKTILSSGDLSTIEKYKFAGQVDEILKTPIDRESLFETVINLLERPGEGRE